MAAHRGRARAHCSPTFAPWPWHSPNGKVPAMILSSSMGAHPLILHRVGCQRRHSFQRVGPTRRWRACVTGIAGWDQTVLWWSPRLNRVESRWISEIQMEAGPFAAMERAWHWPMPNPRDGFPKGRRGIPSMPWMVNIGEESAKMACLESLCWLQILLGSRVPKVPNQWPLLG
jgi:hypothetical protein